MGASSTLGRAPGPSPTRATKQNGAPLPLSPQAVALLAGMVRREADPDCPHVFLGNGTGRPLTTVRRLWLAHADPLALLSRLRKRVRRARGQGRQRQPRHDLADHGEAA